ncbi:neutral/alkaline non-lysosomal ceramidase N-terminal domain-containing protein [Olivibacter sp. SDN3]|nr:neutral/alkaline non-lysosomal ceramidase N-terminal domain-containing protein [Olivibacter sp. SDN3]
MIGKNRMLVVLTLLCCCFALPSMAEEASWKVGLAKTVITPKEPMWMGGYAFRDQPSKGKIHDLWAKAIALEDAGGKTLLCISTDLLGIPKIVEDRLCEALTQRLKLSREQILLNSSHTHSAPVLEGALRDVYPANEAEKAKIVAYSAWLVEVLTDLAQEALADKVSAKLSVGSGFAQFQVNRRNNKEGELRQLHELKGPNDFSVPVIKVTGTDGELMALLFSYACHATVLSGYDWSGDYVGFAQLELEERYAGCQAMFFQGAGADQNPLPRQTLGHAKQYGKVLAAAVEQLMIDDAFQPLEPQLNMAFREIPLPLDTIPAEADLTALLEKGDVPDYTQRWAARLLERLQKGDRPERDYPYPIQCVQLGKQLLFALGGELTVQYALDLKEAFGNQTIVFGYSNDVMGYIPSERILKEGGYEGESSQMVYGHHAKWQQGIEQRIIDACKALYSDLQ